jgi:hypothetical protein
VPAHQGAWSPDDIESAADDHAGARPSDEVAVIHVLFVHGRLEGNDSVLGATIRGDTAAIFSDQVRAASTLLVGAAELEQAVSTHELGHMLGLVDLVLATRRADPEHPGHSRNRASVMYWAVESDLVTQVLDGGPSRDFDDADRADLAAIRSA